MHFKTPNIVKKTPQFLVYFEQISPLQNSKYDFKTLVSWEKNLPKSFAVLTFSCGTIGMNSRFLLVVLLFQRYYRVNFGRFKLET